MLPTIGNALGIGTLSGLADNVVGKIFGKGPVGCVLVYPARLLPQIVRVANGSKRGNYILVVFNWFRRVEKVY